MTVLLTQAMLNLFSFSVGTMEAALNTYATADQSIIVGEGDFIQKAPQRETNKGQATGSEESTRFYDNGQTYTMSFNPEYATYNVIAFLFAYGMGKVTTTAKGTGFSHYIEPITGFTDHDRSNPTLTVIGRTAEGIQHKRCASFGVQSITETYEPGAWVKVSANLVGTGKFEKLSYEEDVVDLDNVTSLTLPTAVPGATAEERLLNVPTIRVDYNGIFQQFIDPLAVSDADPAVVTIASLGGAGGSVTYKVQYRHPDPAWLPQPAIIEEPEVKVAQVNAVFGGSWNDTTKEFQGGRTVCSDLGSLSATFTNEGLEPKMTPCSLDPDQQYAGVMKRSGRMQTITLTREKRSALYESIFDRQEYVGLYIDVIGPLFPGDTERFGYQRVWPKCSFLNIQDTVVDGKVYETATFEVNQGEGVPSSILIVDNLVSQYAVAP